MYSEKAGLLSPRRDDTQREVVVKLKATRAVRGVLRSLAADGRHVARKGALDRWLASSKLRSMIPVFGDAPRRGVAAFRRMAIAAETEADRALAGLNVLSLRSTRDAERACAELARDPLVESAYIPPPRYVLAVRRTRSSRDPLVSRQWGLHAIGLFEAEQATAFREARDVVVAIIDSGIDPDHPDLQGVVSEDRSFTHGSNKDTSGHGTHVAGIVAARRNNDLGIRGVCASRKIMSLKALDPYSAVGYYQAIRHATDHGAQVINLSVGGSFDPTEQTLIRRAMSKGVVVVAAMGNEKLEGNAKSYPGAIGGVIAVGASDEADGVAEFSNTGSHIDLVAPGVNVLSTVPTYASSLASRTDYEAWPGTSMAAPHVAGAAALLLARRPGASHKRVRQALVRGADRVPGQRRFNTTFGHGRLNVLAALRAV